MNILPVAQYPDITPPTVQVSAVYPGANAETVAQTVGIPIEQQVNGVDGMLYMSSNSSASGAYSLTVTFEVGTDIDMATVMVQNRVSVALNSLPEAVKVQGVTVQKQSSNIVMMLTLSGDSIYDGLYLTNYANLNLVDQLTRVPGVGAVDVMGAGDYSMRVWLNPETMRIRNITPQQVYAAIQSQNMEVSAGYVGQPIGSSADNDFQYTLNVKGRLSTPEEFGDIILRVEDQGKVLRLKDVAKIELGSAGRLSFEAAMLNLGGRVLGFASADSSSASKGESVADTIRVISCFADICAMRHPKEGAPMVASLHSSIPVINAGDGGHQHPTQTLTDLMTIRSLKGRLNNLTVGLCGDLKFGRTVHSLINALSRYTGIRFVLISPPELRVPDYIIEDTLNAKGIEYKEVENLDEAMPELDILYMTRVQRERFFNEEDYIRMKDCYILDKKKMELARDDMFVLHPLPRVNEISVEVDNDPRAAYFKQVQYGVYVRMALIMTLLEVEKPC